TWFRVVEADTGHLKHKLLSAVPEGIEDCDVRNPRRVRKLISSVLSEVLTVCPPVLIAQGKGGGCVTHPLEPAEPVYPHRRAIREHHQVERCHLRSRNHSADGDGNRVSRVAR